MWWTAGIIIALIFLSEKFWTYRVTVLYTSNLEDARRRFRVIVADRGRFRYWKKPQLKRMDLYTYGDDQVFNASTNECLPFGYSASILSAVRMHDKEYPQQRSLEEVKADREWFAQL